MSYEDLGWVLYNRIYAPPPTTPSIKLTQSQSTLASSVLNALAECRFAPSRQADIASDTRKSCFQKYDAGWVRLEYLGLNDGTSKWLVLPSIGLWYGGLRYPYLRVHSSRLWEWSSGGHGGTLGLFGVP